MPTCLKGFLFLPYTKRGDVFPADPTRPSLPYGVGFSFVERPYADKSAFTAFGCWVDDSVEFVLDISARAVFTLGITVEARAIDDLYHCTVLDRQDDEGLGGCDRYVSFGCIDIGVLDVLES